MIFGEEKVGSQFLMKNLERPDSIHLEAAEGWLGLGDIAAAHDELEQISAPLRAHPVVLVTRCEIYGKAGKWDAVATIADTLVKMMPDESSGWIQRSFALHELKCTQEAFDNLLPVAVKFPRVWNIPYNLACYCAQLGRLDECQDWFKKAMAIDEETVKQQAIDDPDLKPLWDSMGGTMWKRT